MIRPVFPLLCSLLLLTGAVASRTAAASASASPAASLPLNPGEHVAIVGNALGDRMQHHGSLETLLHARHPLHRLVVRNLAVSGDELATRARSKDFGTPDEWLTRVRAGVVFAFFGFNESFKGPEGLAKFKEDLAQFLSETRAQNYNGMGPPRIVLFSPIANEQHPDPNFAVPPENNVNLALYTAAMAEVAADRAGVTFVDLFAPSQQLFAAAAREGRPLTFNGIHLNEEGDARLAAVIDRALFGGPPPAGDHSRLRAAINEKNAMWHSRYRTPDGYNVYGGRSQLAFDGGEGTPKISNNQVMQEEMNQRDVMTANRDQRIWAVAQGGDLVVDDSNLPPVTPVPTNRPGPNPDGTFPFLGGEEAISKMTLHPGLKVNLFASEEQFPQLAKPVQMAWDTRGRLWVAVWPNYPLRRPDSRQGDSLLIFEDTDGDGRADRCITFLEDLNAPTGFQFYKDGVLVVQPPDLWFARDTNGDGRADWKERVLMGLDSADTHHTSNSLALDPGGALYLSDGVFHRTQVETPTGPVRSIDGGIHRFEPRTGRFEIYVAYSFANPHGRVFDRWGNDFITDGTGNRTYFGPAFSGHIDFPGKHAPLKEFWPRPARPSATSTILTSRHFPEDFHGNFLNGNVIGFLGFYRVRIEEDGSGLKGVRLTDFLSSSDPNFRPVSISTGPDGAVYLLDWHNPIIGHMQHHLRDPNRDSVHGRIYRVTHEGRALLKQPKIYDQPIDALLELLKEPENHVRELAKIELGRHDSGAVVAAVNRWITRLDPGHPEHQHRLTEALWVHQWHNVVDAALLRRMLRSPNGDARAAATRVLSYWRDRVPDALALLKVQAADEHPRVRLQAVRAASFFRTEAAADVALTATRFPLDYYLEYTLGETLKQLAPYWRDALADPGSPIASDPARITYLLRTVSAAGLLKMPRTKEVLQQVLVRPGVPEAARTSAMNDLARMLNRSIPELLLAEVEGEGEIDKVALGRLLVARPPAELKAVRARLARLAAEPAAAIPEYFWAAAIMADGSFDAAWREAQPVPHAFVALLASVPLVTDSALRASVYERVAPFLERSSVPAGPADTAEKVQAAAIRAAVSTRRESDAMFQTLTQLIRRDEAVAVAAEGLRMLPRSSWVDADPPATMAVLVQWLNRVPRSDRRDPAALGVLQLAEELGGRLPAATAAPFLQQLASFRVPVFHIRAVPEEMRYDTTRIVVEPGRQIQLIFENPDVMPHNLVVVKPGTRERIGTAAMLLGPDHLDTSGRAYVPDTSDILAATKMLETGQTEMIRVIPPHQEGVYEFVCTFPGHWTVMWGEIIVTRDPQAYLERRKAPAAAAAGPPVPAAPAGKMHQHGK